MGTIYALGPFRLDAHNEVLLRGTEPVALGRRAVALLRALVERRGELVSKDVLIETAWPGLAVEDSNLTVQIAALRRVLGGAPGGDRWIETMPRRGYRFIGPVVASERDSVVAAPRVDAAQGSVPIEHGPTSAPPQTDVAREAVPTRYGEAERRQITVLSCELVAMAAGTHGLDLDDLRDTVRDFQRCVSETAGRHEGFIARHLGNGALVLFGYPEAHEHDAEQAVRAGVELCAVVRALRPDMDTPMRCRVAVATGLVIIGDRVGVGEFQDHKIVGAVPGMVARLLVSTPPDTVAIDPATRCLIGNLFDCRELGAVEIAGGGEPMRNWQVLAESTLASRFEALRGSALSPLVGRSEEIDLLLRCWERARAGDGQVVVISGEPGLGKSRITAAFEERLQAEPHGRLRYFCSPYHQDSALFPVIDQLGQAAGFARDDPPASKLEKLELLLASAAPPNEDVALLADLMSLPASERHPLPNLSPQRKKERTLEALIRQLEGLSHENPVVAVFEDAHWLDPTSRELLDLIVERVRRLPALLIVTFRPGMQPSWAGQPQVSTLTLNRLDQRDGAALVAQIAGSKTLPHEVVLQIAERTDGVPLFVEELTKSVLESGLLREENDRYVLDRPLQPLAIPMTLHASLLARLDRLAAVRPVAQVGAAIGRQFPYALLLTVCRLPEDVLQTAIDRLVASELVFQRGTPPDAIYTFKHALVQDAAYGSLLRKARQQLHARIAEALETDSPEIVESQPELLAQHYAEAGFVEKSVTYWGKAGRRSVARSAMAEAAEQLRKRLDQLVLLPDTRERQQQELEFLSALALVLRAVKGFAALETGQVYTRARDLWEQLGFPSEFLHIPYGHSRNHLYRGELDLALRSDKDLLRLSRQRNDSAWLVVGHGSSGLSLLAAGRFGSCRSHFEEVLALYDPISHCTLVHQAIHVNSQAILGIALFCLGFPDQASAQSGVAIAEARRLAHAVSLAAILSADAWRHSLAGDDAALNERADELVAVTTERGFALWGALGALYRGWGKIKRDEVVEGMSLIRGGLVTYRGTGTELWMPYFTDLLAKACEIAGQIEEATALADEALQIIKRTGERWFEAELYRHKGRLLLRQGHPEAAEELYHKALSIAREQEAKLWELRAAASLARLRRDQGRRPEAHAVLAPVYGWFTEGFDTLDLKDARALLDQLRA